MWFWWIKIVILSAKRLCDYAVQVSCDQVGGEGGVSQNITFDHKGGGGGLERAQIWSRDTWTAPNYMLVSKVAFSYTDIPAKNNSSEKLMF